MISSYFTIYSINRYKYIEDKAEEIVFTFADKQRKEEATEFQIILESKWINIGQKNRKEEGYPFLYKIRDKHDSYTKREKRCKGTDPVQDTFCWNNGKDFIIPL